ncbi:MAG: histidine kinase N-terminal 7TM domain-containing protein [Patescibacteria group bacterium]
MNIIQFFALLSSVANLSLGIFVATRAKGVAYRRWFALVAFTISTWAFASFLSLYQVNSFTFLALTFALGSLVAGFNYIWIRSLIQRPLSKFLIFCVLVVTFLIALFTFVPGLMVQSFLQTAQESASYGELGPLFSIYAFWVAGLLLLAIYHIAKAWHRENGLRRKQFGLVTLALLLPVAPVIFVDFVLPMLANSVQVNVLDSTFSCIFVGLAAYAITRYRFLGIRLIFRTSVATLALYILVGIAYAILFMVLHAVVATKDAFIRVLMPSALSAIFALLTIPTVISKAQNFLRTHEERRIESMLVLPKIVQKTSVKEFIMGLEKIFREEYHFSSSVVYFVDKTNLNFTAFSSTEKINNSQVFIKILKRTGQILVTEELALRSEEGLSNERKECAVAYKYLKAKKIDIVTPFGKGEDILGFALLSGNKVRLDSDLFLSLREAQVKIIPVLLGVILSENMLKLRNNADEQLAI